MSENRLPLAPEGFVIIGVVLAIMLAVTVFLGWKWGLLPFAFLIFTLWFFREPHPIIPPVDPTPADNLETVFSPADGTIIGISEVEERRFLNKPLRRISIFMSPINAHINRAPLAGEVLKAAYNPGKYFNAASDKASLDNEQRAILMRSTKGVEMVFVLIAGFIARRIVSYPKPGDHLTAGQRIGMIRFGSRVDVYLPLTAKIAVGLKQKVSAGETPLARVGLPVAER